MNILEILFVSLIAIVEVFTWAFRILTALVVIGYDTLADNHIIIVVSLIALTIWMLT